MTAASIHAVVEPVETKAEVFRRLSTLAPELRRLGVKRCGLFGSLVHDNPRHESDVDLLVEFFPDLKSFDNFMEAAELLELTLGRRVEILTPQSLSPHLGPHILREVQYVALHG
jgi:predicted nucleotidyltransferase